MRLKGAGFHMRKLHLRKSAQNIKAHLNKFFWTISVGVPDSCHREEGKKFARTFRKSSCKRCVVLVFQDLGWFVGL